MKTVRLLLVDDHALFGQSLARLLAAEPDFQIATHCSSIDDAIAVLQREPVDVVLLDFDLGEERAPQFLDRVRDLGLSLRILVVTAGIQPADAAKILEQGAAGIFLKLGSPAQLVEVVRKIHAGGTWIDESCMRELVRIAANPDPAPSNQKFTEREQHVLHGVFEGRSNKEIAAALAISESSVKAALQQLFNKTGVRTRSQLVRVALEHYQGEWNT